MVYCYSVCRLRQTRFERWMVAPRPTLETISREESSLRIIVDQEWTVMFKLPSPVYRELAANLSSQKYRPKTKYKK